MNHRMILRNLANSKVVSLTTILFVAAASLLLSLAAALAVNLSGAVGQLMLDAKTPHFMQMHSGDPSLPALQAFAAQNENVEAFQVRPFLNVDNTKIVLGGRSLSNSLQDNGFTTQSKQFDFLLDANSQPVYPQRGELYVPVCYWRDGTARLGDPASIGGRPFVVAGFIRDSQMNSSLASSKRFLVSEADYEQLALFGTAEYLIEFRLQDQSALSAFEAAYRAAGLPANGPALTYPLFQMLSAVSDGVMIAVLLLIGLLVILVALLCIRFTLLAKMEDDYREIGIMKAVGMRLSDIRNLYLTLYAALAAIGCVLGFVLALLLQPLLLQNIRLNLGGSGNSAAALLLGMAGAALVFLCILLSVCASLRRFRRISAVQALQFGMAPGDSRGADIVKLSESKRLSVNFLLGLKDVLSRKRLYATMLAVVVLSSFIMIVPHNLYHTISGDHFVTYIGVGSCDLRMDIQQTSGIDEKTAAVGSYLSADPAVSNYALFVSKIFPVKLENGETASLKTELGDHTVFPLEYTLGRMPVQPEDIALSSLNAEELGKTVGDSIALVTSSGEQQLTVCGIYSDITNGGKTAKAVFTDAAAEPIWSVVCADLSDKAALPNKLSEYAGHFPFAKVSSIAEYMAQTFGQTLRSVRSASLSALLVSAAITLLVTLLFMKLLSAKDRYSIAVLRTVGFTRSDIRRQYAWRAAMVLAAGIALGTLLAGTLGERLSAAAISTFGAAAFQFTVDPLFTYLLSPLILFVCALLAVSWGAPHADMAQLSEAIKE